LYIDPQTRLMEGVKWHLTLVHWRGSSTSLLTKAPARLGMREPHSRGFERPTKRELVSRTVSPQHFPRISVDVYALPTVVQFVRSLLCFVFSISLGPLGVLGTTHPRLCHDCHDAPVYRSCRGVRAGYLAPREGRRWTVLHVIGTH